MSQRCTVRLPDDLVTRLQQEVEASGRALSDVVRQALETFLLRVGQGTDTGAQSPPTAVLIPPPPDREAAWLPGPPSLRVFEAARPQVRQMPPWAEYRLRRQGSEASSSTTHSPSTPGAA
jgi:hypothetical protein